MYIVHNSNLKNHKFKTSERNLTVVYCDTNYLLHFVVVTVQYTFITLYYNNSNRLHCNIVTVIVIQCTVIVIVIVTAICIFQVIVIVIVI